MDENDTAATEQPTMAAITTASTVQLNGVFFRPLAIFSPAERIR